MVLKLLIKSNVIWYAFDAVIPTELFCPHFKNFKMESNDNLQFSKWIDSIKDVLSDSLKELVHMSCLFMNQTVLDMHCFMLWFSKKNTSVKMSFVCELDYFGRTGPTLY